MSKINKATIPVRENIVLRALAVFPRRLLHLLYYAMRKEEIPFYSRKLQPNYSEYRVIDADARHSIDPFDMILWFRARGDRILSHPTLMRAILARSGTLVVKVESYQTVAHVM